MDFVLFLRAAALLLLCLLATAVGALEETQDKRCISLMRIDSVEVLDSQHLVFHMRGRKNYLNVLPHRCPGLKKDQPFMYRTSLSVLCDLDLITVLDTGGFGLRPMASCGLGRFSPMLDTNVEAIRDNLKIGDQ